MPPSRVTKKRSDSKNQHPIQYWDGKTYACLACKRGHRVKLCDHGKDGKLVSATNQPGRPSSGSDRKCTCPKTCNCATNCKCVKEGCICVQKMFLVVALKSKPKPIHIDKDPEPVPQWTDENGEEKTLNPVYTDLNGNVLSPEEAQAREEERERRKNEGSKKSSCCSSTQSTEESSPSSGGVCRHREKLEATLLPDIVQSPTPNAASSRCTCGAKCQCTLCPEHPNNTATRQYNARQLNAMANNPNGAYMPTHSIINPQLFKPETPQESCLGGEASYFLTRQPPTLHDFQRLFPDYAPGDFVLTYPMDAPMHVPNQQNDILPASEIDSPEHSFTYQMSMLPGVAENLQLAGNKGYEAFFNDQSLSYTFGDADVTTFGNQPLDMQQSPIQTHLMAFPATQQPPSQTVPSLDIDLPQTIHPELLQTRSPYSSIAQQSIHPAPSFTPGGSEIDVQHDVYFDNTFSSVLDDTQLGFEPCHSTLRQNPRFDHSLPNSSKNPLTSPAP